MLKEYFRREGEIKAVFTKSVRGMAIAARRNFSSKVEAIRNFRLYMFL